MGQIKNSVVLEKALRGIFMKSYDNGENPADVMPMIMETSSTSNKEKYGWLGNVPDLSEWKDSRKLYGVSDYDYEIPNKSYEGTLQVDRDDIEDDQIGGIKIRIGDLARKAKIHPRKLFFELIINGEVGLCFDGLPFYSVSHAYKGVAGVQSNLITGTKAGALPTASEMKADFVKMRAAMRDLKDDTGAPFNEGALKLHIIASPDLEGVLDTVFGADLIDSTTNTLKGAATYMTTGRLSGADWYVFENSGSLKAVVKQTRQNIRFEALEATSEQGFMNKLYKYGVDYRVGFGYGMWQKAMKLAY